MTTSTSSPTIDVPVIVGTAEIDPPWLTAALGASHPGVRVDDFRIESVGAGNVSDTVKVTLTYGDRPDGAPDAVVVKLRPSVDAIHAHGLASGAYHREIGAYRTITESAACRIPKLFHVAGDETNINLVIEDLTHATPGDQVAGCGVPEAKAVLAQAARLHATLPMDLSSAPSWPIRLAEVADYWTEKMEIGASAAATRYAGMLTQDELALIADATKVVRDWHLLPQRVLTLTHGDPRVDNVLFEQTPDGLGAVLIDWQVTGIRNPMYDVGYFLSGSIDANVRRPAEDELLEHYVAEFERVRPGAYSIKQAREDLGTQMLSGLVITTAAIAVLPDNDVVTRLIVALLRRNIASAQDWDSVAKTKARS